MNIYIYIEREREPRLLNWNPFVTEFLLLVFNSNLWAWVPPRFRLSLSPYFSLNRHFPKSALVTLPCRQHTNGRNDAGKNWYRAKRTPIASYIFICVFGARRVSVYLCRPIESQNRVERKVTRTQGVCVVRLCLEAERECTLRPTDQPYLLSESGRVANCSTCLPTCESGNPTCNYHLRSHGLRASLVTPATFFPRKDPQKNIRREKYGEMRGLFMCCRVYYISF